MVEMTQKSARQQKEQRRGGGGGTSRLPPPPPPPLAAESEDQYVTGHTLTHVRPYANAVDCTSPFEDVRQALRAASDREWSAMSTMWRRENKDHDLDQKDQDQDDQECGETEASPTSATDAGGGLSSSALPLPLSAARSAPNAPPYDVSTDAARRKMQALVSGESWVMDAGPTVATRATGQDHREDLLAARRRLARASNEEEMTMTRTKTNPRGRDADRDRRPPCPPTSRPTGRSGETTLTTTHDQEDEDLDLPPQPLPLPSIQPRPRSRSASPHARTLGLGWRGAGAGGAGSSRSSSRRVSFAGDVEDGDPADHPGEALSSSAVARVDYVLGRRPPPTPTTSGPPRPRVATLSCLRCGLNDTTSPGECRFHPALVQAPGPFLYGVEWQACKLAGHGAQDTPCFTRQGHFYPVGVPEQVLREVPLADPGVLWGIRERSGP